MFETLLRHAKIAFVPIAIVALTVACNADGDVTAPNLVDDTTQGLKHHSADHDKGGGNGGGGGDDDGGSTDLASFEWRVAGDVGFVPDEDPDLISEHRLKKNMTNVVATFQEEDVHNRGKKVDVGFLIDQGIPNAETCFGDGDGTVESSDGILPPGSFVMEGENQPSMFSQIVFTASNQDGTETIKYKVLMNGSLESGDPWLPGVGETANISLSSWELSTQNRDKKKNPCVGTGTFGFDVDITRTQ